LNRTAVAVLAGCALFCTGLAQADTPVLRLGEHPGFTRAVFEFGGQESATASRDGNTVVVRAPDLPPITRGGAGRILAVAGVAGEARMTVPPYARVRVQRLGRRLVIDVLDAVPDAPAPRSSDRHAAGQKSTKHPEPKPPVPPGASAQGAKPPQTAASSGGGSAPKTLASGPRPSGTALPAPTPEPRRDPARATRQSVPPAGEPPAGGSSATAASPSPTIAVSPTAQAAFLLPVGETVGAAAFRRGGTGIVVLDAPRILDFAPVHEQPGLPPMRAETLPAATVLRIPLQPAEGLLLTRKPEGWVISVLGNGPSVHGIVPEFIEGAVRFPLAGAGAVVTIPDPIGGGTLLVGTQRTGGQAIAVARMSPGFQILPTYQGIALETLTDDLELRPGGPGFVLSAGGGGRIALAPPPSPAAQAAADAAALTRRFDLPDLPIRALLHRLEGHLAEAVRRPRSARFGPRIAVAQDLVALGLGPEAQGVLRVAAEDDPVQAKASQPQALAAVAALLAGRAGEASYLNDPMMGATDEAAFWRAALTPGSPGAAEVFAVEWPLLLAYPETLRRRLLPRVAEALARAGKSEALARLLQHGGNDPAFDLARGLDLARQGRTDQALATFATVAAGRDRHLRYVAAREAVETALAAGRIDDRTAAARLARLLLAWRGDEEELSLRLRVAALQARSGALRPAFELLRDTESAFPDRLDAVHRAQGEAIGMLLNGGAASLPPLELVALAEESADWLGQSPRADELAPVLADKLLALDLPQRALPVLRRMLAGTQNPVARGELGLRIATLLLDQDDAPGAQNALVATNDPALPAPLAARRRIAYARALAAQGKSGAALDAIAGLRSPEADELQARLAAQTGNWQTAELSLQDLASALPEAGPLTPEQEEQLLRLAGAAVQAGDSAALRKLQEQFAARFAPGHRADMFRLLTAPPISGPGDLARAAQELDLARTAERGAASR
jgi:hypothetical protein